MQKNIKKIIGSSKIINKLYYYLGSLIINVFKLFVRKQDNLILFVSYGGKYYNDSPKAIYEAMLEDSRFKKYDFVWAFKNPENFNVRGHARFVKIDTIKYFWISLKARVWISNAPIERRLNYKGKNTYYFCTWHGTPIKKLGKEVSNTYTRIQYDAICAQGEFDVKIFPQVFNIKKENIVRCGLPRNDVLIPTEKKDQNKMKERLKIPLNKKAILYCPTFRDWQDNFISEAVDFSKWERLLGNNYIILFRAHSMVTEAINTGTKPDFVYDVSDYQDLNDLMIASDMLISDYSSTFFDYSLLEKPMFCYTYDYDEYALKRGVYFDIRKELPGGSISEEKLMGLILNMSNEKVIKMVRAFRNNFVEFHGNATSKSLDVIFENI